MMSDIELIYPEQHKQWMSVLYQMGDYDFYHLPTYHALAQERGEGNATLLVYRQKNKFAALPLLLRSVDSVPALAGYRWKDATSVYGYPGPVLNEPAAKDQAFINQFQQALKIFASEKGLVTVFSRLNPVLGNECLLQGLGELNRRSETVSIDLTLDPDEQFASYCKSHRYEVRRARKEGIVAYRDETGSAYDKFIELYLDTMSRVGAKSRYRFDREYFDSLRKALGDRLKLFVAEMDGEVCAGALFVHTRDIIQYHLAGSHQAYRKLAPMKVVIDEARLWGNKVGASQLHLGGGVGSKKDSLFKFKAGFSGVEYRFYTWSWVVMPDVYQELIRIRAHFVNSQVKAMRENGFFPAYRL